MTKHDLIVIGGGPGGYVAAIRAAQLGLDVGLIDANRPLGGTCLRVGCIPSKALLESSQRFAEAQGDLQDHGVKLKSVELDLSTLLLRKEQIVASLTQGINSLVKANKINHYLGYGRLAGAGRVVVDGDEGQTELEAQHIVLATGSKPAKLKGVELDGQIVGYSTTALSYDEVPKHLVVIGAGYIGLELGSVWRRLGAKVTVLEALDRIFPGMDTQLANEAQRIFEKQGIEFRLGSRVKRAAAKRGRAEVECEEGAPIKCDRVLLAIGRAPNTDGLDLQQAGVECDGRGRIEVDDTFTTSATGVYAIGDCIRGPMLAHKASEEGVACVERIVTGYGHVNYDAIPAVAYTHPELASVGRTEEQLQEAGVEYRVGSFRFIANGRARALGDTAGRVKILADKRTDRILGVHILGPRAGDLIAEAVAAIEFGASSEDLARTCHAHPTLSEAIHEAALAVDGRALHGG